MNQSLNRPTTLDHPIYPRLLGLLQAHRFATTTQLARLTADAYTSLRSATRQTLRHLNQLLEQHMVTCLERRVGGWRGGSTAGIWALTTHGARTLTLRPDLHAVVTSPGYQDHYFIEVDRDAENPARVITTCHRYQAYYATGIEQQAGGVFPVTLWIVPHDRRQRQLQRYLDAESDLNPHLFAVTTQQQLPEIITSGPPTTDQAEEDPS